MALNRSRAVAGLMATGALLAACASSAPPAYPVPPAPTAPVSAGTSDGKPAPTAGSRFNPASGTTNTSK